MPAVVVVVVVGEGRGRFGPWATVDGARIYSLYYLPRVAWSPSRMDTDGTTTVATVDGFIPARVRVFRPRLPAKCRRSRDPKGLTMTKDTQFYQKKNYIWKIKCDLPGSTRFKQSISNVGTAARSTNVQRIAAFPNFPKRRWRRTMHSSPRSGSPYPSPR